MWSQCLCGATQFVDPRSGTPEHHPPRLVVNVWNCQASLAVCDGMNVVSLDVQPPRRMLERAIRRAGGAINISGYYPATPELERWARSKGLIA